MATLKEQIATLRKNAKADIKAAAQALMDAKEDELITEIKRIALTGVSHMNLSAFLPTTDKITVEVFAKLFAKKHDLTFEIVPFSYVKLNWDEDVEEVVAAPIETNPANPETPV